MITRFQLVEELLPRKYQIETDIAKEQKKERVKMIPVFEKTWMTLLP